MPERGRGRFADADFGSSSFDGTSRLWDSVTGECLRVFQDHKRHVYALAFSPDGSSVASAGLDAKVCIWNITDGTLLHIFAGASPVLSLAWVKDGVLLCGAEDGSISMIYTSSVCGSPQ